MLVNIISLDGAGFHQVMKLHNNVTIKTSTFAKSTDVIVQNTNGVKKSHIIRFKREGGKLKVDKSKDHLKNYCFTTTNVPCPIENISTKFLTKKEFYTNFLFTKFNEELPDINLYQYLDDDEGNLVKFVNTINPHLIVISDNHKLVRVLSNYKIIQIGGQNAYEKTTMKRINMYPAWNHSYFVEFGDLEIEIKPEIIDDDLVTIAKSSEGISLIDVLFSTSGMTSCERKRYLINNKWEEGVDSELEFSSRNFLVKVVRRITSNLLLNEILKIKGDINLDSTNTTAINDVKNIIIKLDELKELFTSLLNKIN